MMMNLAVEYRCKDSNNSAQCMWKLKKDECSEQMQDTNRCRCAQGDGEGSRSLAIRLEMLNQTIDWRLVIVSISQRQHPDACSLVFLDDSEVIERMNGVSDDIQSDRLTWQQTSCARYTISHYRQGLQQGHHHNGNRATQRPHILCSICVTIHLVIASLHNQPICPKMCSSHQPVVLKLKGELLDPKFGDYGERGLRPI